MIEVETEEEAEFMVDVNARLSWIAEKAVVLLAAKGTAIQDYGPVEVDDAFCAAEALFERMEARQRVALLRHREAQSNEPS